MSILREAVDLLTRANTKEAKASLPVTQNNLGRALINVTMNLSPSEAIPLLKEALEWFIKSAKNDYVDAVYDISIAQCLLEKALEKLAESVWGTFNYLRSIGNEASDEELTGYLLKDKGWDAFTREEKTKTVAQVVEGKERSELNELLSKQNYSLTYRSIRALGNKASDEELVRFLLESNGYKGWDMLSSVTKIWVVTKIVEGMIRSVVTEFLGLKDFPRT
jgi:TPR repeat protein